MDIKVFRNLIAIHAIVIIIIIAAILLLGNQTKMNHTFAHTHTLYQQDIVNNYHCIECFIFFVLAKDNFAIDGNRGWNVDGGGGAHHI